MRSVTWIKGGDHPPSSIPQFNQSRDPLGPVVAVTFSVNGLEPDVNPTQVKDLRVAPLGPHLLS